jgi:hypothetical protein
LPVVHKLNELYRLIYEIGLQLPKNHRLGIWLRVESLSLEIQELVLTAVLEKRNYKLLSVSNARIKTELLKKIIRSAFEISVINKSAYFRSQEKLREISKMLTGWLSYLDKENPRL